MEQTGRYVCPVCRAFNVVSLPPSRGPLPESIPCVWPCHGVMTPEPSGPAPQTDTSASPAPQTQTRHY